jgi:hypothetical protein
MGDINLNLFVSILWNNSEAAATATAPKRRLCRTRCKERLGDTVSDLRVLLLEAVEVVVRRGGVYFPDSGGVTALRG